MIRTLLITLIPVSGCVTGSIRDTDRAAWPAAYTEQDRYYVVGWRERFIVKPGPTRWEP